MHKKQPFPGTDITREKYQCGSSLFRITAQRRKIQILRNYTQKTAFIFPSERYRMPAHGKVQIFGEENTYPVPDPSKFNEMCIRDRFRNRFFTTKLRIEKLDSETHENILHDLSLIHIWISSYEHHNTGWVYRKCKR